VWNTLEPITVSARGVARQDIFYGDEDYSEKT
jgi:hypothetical protein